MTAQTRSPLRPPGRCHPQSCRNGQCGAEIGLDRAGMDRLMPLHVIVSLDGQILRAGPTISKLAGGRDLVGEQFLTHFDLRLPKEIDSIADLIERSGEPLRLSLRDRTRTGLKGQAVGLSCGGSVLIDMSFGIAIVEAARRFSLTSSDFGGTDLGIEMLFLAEAQHAALAETRRFSRRLERARAAAEKDASTDRLTGAHNRRAMDDLLSDLVAQMVPFSLVLLDIDDLGRINERFGRPGGDAVLREVCQALRDCVRPEDMVARIGGDEFALIVSYRENGPTAERVAKRVLSRAAMTLSEDPLWTLQVSLGAVMGAPGQWPTPDAAMRAAEEALDAAKRAGGGQYRLVDEPL
ncbi:MAG: GGDEF domain-containing protein [Pseudomonadota bacterium]